MVEAGQTLVFSKTICYTKSADGIVTPLVRRNKGFDMDIQIQKPKDEIVPTKKSVGSIQRPMTQMEHHHQAMETLQEEVDEFEARVAQDRQDREDQEQGRSDF